MKLRDVFPFLPDTAAPASTPRASFAGEGVAIGDLSSPEAQAWLRSGLGTNSGALVGVEAAMRVAAAWRCIHIISGAAGNMSLCLRRRVSPTEHQDADDHPLSAVLNKRPNGWQTPSEFKKMLTAWKLLRGNGYGLKITSRGRVIEIWPMHPDRVECVQNADMSLSYAYTTLAGKRIPLQQDEVFHLRGLTLNGVTGLGVLKHAREAIGLSLQVEAAGARLFRQGVMAGGAFKTPTGVKLSDEAYNRLKEQLEDRNSGAENAHKWLILEEGADVAQIALNADDAQMLATREFERSDIAMFFGVPPHLIGAVEKTTSFGAGIEQQNIGFSQYTLDDHFVAWEETTNRDLLSTADVATGYYAYMDRDSLLRGDTNTRWANYVRGLQWSVLSPDEVRAKEGMNPRPDGKGDQYFAPPNTAGDAGAALQGPGFVPPQDQ